ncbi:hypothetical protein D3C76_1883840 [compost metagenome]
MMLRWRAVSEIPISRPLSPIKANKAVIRLCGATTVRPSSAGKMISVPRLNTTIAMTKKRAGR